MGLDMYLTARKYFWSDDENSLDKEIKKLFKTDLEVSQVEFQVHTWRKARAIHEWFVSNVQGGDDDCRHYDVEVEILQKLLRVIKKILGENTQEEKIVNSLSGCADFDKDIAEELLPSDYGFSDDENNKWYYEDLISTRDMLEKILNNSDKYKGLEFCYNSSW